MSFFNLNGKLLSSESGGIMPGNRALRYGYGLFETMLVQGGRIRLAKYHWERLKHGLATLHIEVGAQFIEQVETELWRTIRKAKHEALCRVRLQVYTGDGGLYDGGFNAGFIIETFPVGQDTGVLNTNGFVAGFADAIKNTGPFSCLKTCSALPYAMSARQAKAARWNDALLLNEHGGIAESTIANVFWTKSGRIFTPPLSEGCVAGIMRQHILTDPASAGFDVSERQCTKADIAAADSIFLTNAIYGIRWVGQLQETKYTVGICEELYHKLIHTLP